MPPVAFANELGLRDYRAAVETASTPAPRWPWFVLLAFLAGLACGTHLQAAEPCVGLQVRPPVLLSRGDVDVQARVARHADHETLEVDWDSDDAGAGSRRFELAGANDRVLFQWWNQDQLPANYWFVARVLDRRGRELGTARATIRTAERER